MADIQLQPGESVLGQGMMAYWEPVLGSSCNVWRGTIFVTNQRVCFQISWTTHMEIELRWSEISGFTVGKHLFATKVAIHSKSREKFTFTGFPAKKTAKLVEANGCSENIMQSAARAMADTVL